MFKKVKKCRVCNSTNLRQIINLGDQPPCKFFDAKNDEAEKDSTFFTLLQ